MYELSCKTKSGTEFEVRFMGATVVGVTSVLYVEIVGQEMIDIISVFSNPDETRSIQGLIEGEVKKEFNGYTNLIELIKLAESGNIRVALTQPMDVLGE